MNTSSAGLFSTDAARWAAVMARNAAADGHFVYAVRSTGIYCRPSCGTRRPLRVNVSFHANATAAERAGFRPCKRCRPECAPCSPRNMEQVKAACRRIEQAQEEPVLAELAAVAGLSPGHFHRVFKDIIGVTPKAYARSRRALRAQQALGTAGTVTDALYAARSR